MEKIEVKYLGVVIGHTYELEDKDFNIIYEEFVQLLKKHQDKPFEY